MRLHLSIILTFLLLLPDAGAAGVPLMEAWRRWVEPDLAQVEEELEALRTSREALPVADSRPDFSHPGYRSEAAAQPDSVKWVQIDLGKVMPVDDIVLIPAVMPTFQGTAEPLGFPERFRVDVSSQLDFSEFETAQDFSAADFPDPGLMPVIIRKAGCLARYVRVTAFKLRGVPDNYYFALGELVVCSGNRNVAEGSFVQAQDALESPRWSLPGLVDGISVAGRPVENRSLPTNGYHGSEETRADAVQWVQVDLGAPLQIDEVRLAPARPVDFPDTIGFGFPVRFKVEASLDEVFTKPLTIADHSMADFPNPGDRRLILPAHTITAQYVRVTALQLWPRRRSDDFVFALAEMEVLSCGRNVARDRPVSDSAPLKAATPRWKQDFLVDGIAPREGVGTYADWVEGLARRQAISAVIMPLTARAAVLRENAETRLAWIACFSVTALVVAAVVVIWLIRSRQRRQTRRLRARIAQDLHDEIGSNLSSIGILSQLGAESADPAAMRSDLEEIRRVSAETAESMHDIVWLISPGSKTAGDLSARLRKAAELMLAGMDWTMEVEGLDLAASLRLECQRDVLLIFKEALHNIRRHAGAQRARIELTGSRKLLTLRIADDGRGFDPAGARNGHGLKSMQQRAVTCRGKLAIVSTPGSGTILTLQIPCQK